MSGERIDRMPAGPIENTAPAPQNLKVESSDSKKSKRIGLPRIPTAVGVVFLTAVAVFAGGCDRNDQESTTPTATSAATREPTQIASATPVETIEPASPSPDNSSPTPPTQEASATPEDPDLFSQNPWLRDFPGPWPEELAGQFGNYHAPDAETPIPDPTGKFWANKLTVNFQDNRTGIEIARFLDQLLDQKGLLVDEIKANIQGSFILRVGPEMQTDALNELLSEPNRTMVEYAEKTPR